MAKLFKISYELSNTSQLTAGIVANSKEKATSYLKAKVPSVSKINSVSSVADIHAVDNEVTDQIVNNSEKIKDYKRRITELNNRLSGYEQELQDLQEQVDNKNQASQQPTVTSAEIKEAFEEKTKKLYCCPYCDFETEKKEGLKQHISKKHSE